MEHEHAQRGHHAREDIWKPSLGCLAPHPTQPGASAQELRLQREVTCGGICQPQLSGLTCVGSALPGPLDAPPATAARAARTAAIHEERSPLVTRAACQHSKPAGAAVEPAPPARDPSTSDGACYGDEWLTLPLPSRQMCHATHGHDETACTPSHLTHAVTDGEQHSSLHDCEGACSEGDRTAAEGDRYRTQDHTHDTGCCAVPLQLDPAAAEDRTVVPEGLAAQCGGAEQVPCRIPGSEHGHRTQGVAQQQQQQQQQQACHLHCSSVSQPGSPCLMAASQQSPHHGAGTSSDRRSARSLVLAPLTPGGHAVARDPASPKPRSQMVDTSDPDVEGGGGGARDGPGRCAGVRAAVEAGEAHAAQQAAGPALAGGACAPSQLRRSSGGGGGGSGGCRGGYRVRRCSAPPVELCLGSEVEYAQASGQTAAAAAAAALATASASVPGREQDQQHQPHSPAWGTAGGRPPPLSPLAALRLSPLDAGACPRDLRPPPLSSVAPDSPAASDASATARPRALSRRHTVNFSRVLQPGRHRTGVGHVSRDTGRYAHVDLVGLDDTDVEAVQGLLDRGLLLAATMFIQSRRQLQQQQQQQGQAGAMAGGGRALGRSRSDSQRSCMAYGRASVAAGCVLVEGGREEG